MATLTKERLIYTAGTFKLDEELRVCRRILVYVDVLRKPPSAVYQNERSNPPKHFFGYVTLFIGDYVSKVLPLEYESQLILEYDGLELQLYRLINCSTALLVDTIAALGSVMTPPAILIPVTPLAQSFPGCRYDFIKFKLEPLTRIKVTAFAEEAYGCDGITFPTDLPDLPDRAPPYPPDRPLAEDPARDDPEEGEKPGDTAPASPEDPDQGYIPTEGTPGNIYAVSYTWRQFPGGSLLSEASYVFGPVGSVRKSPSDPFKFQCYCSGKIDNPYAPGTPQPQGWYDIATRAYDTSVEVTRTGVTPWP